MNFNSGPSSPGHALWVINNIVIVLAIMGDGFMAEIITRCRMACINNTKIDSKFYESLCEKIG